MDVIDFNFFKTLSLAPWQHKFTRLTNYWINYCVCVWLLFLETKKEYTNGRNSQKVANILLYEQE